MAKYYRYMSNEEFQKILAGVVLEYTNDAWVNANTTSDGFCFLAEETKFHGEDTQGTFDPLTCYWFLSGIVSKDVLVEFEVDASLLTESQGLYADPFGSWGQRIVITEYFCRSYSRSNFKPVRYGTGFDNYGDPVWHEIKEDD